MDRGRRRYWSCGRFVFAAQSRLRFNESTSKEKERMYSHHELFLQETWLTCDVFGWLKSTHPRNVQCYSDPLTNLDQGSKTLPFPYLDYRKDFFKIMHVLSSQLKNFINDQIKPQSKKVWWLKRRIDLLSVIIFGQAYLLSLRKFKISPEITYFVRGAYII